ncbi:XrtA/PEP-CTERM system TPR-repeat protein PrsT [Thauera aminoaromatica]|uniref:PEP-CTERM system TPR-repeat protein PrsT n=1 Tax=Thauera aminoaromatica TaxID=164330 RepID=A0A5C7S8N2_THASP|nr:XrtA/PEP-CTERM system TPR-repeat protein PrsT [Thauera aminoaromatica]TXH79305.1 MAG: PEP-CTERM system TPR-repeat protein PrsT [Thauera aminoaromatica]
MPIRNTLCRHAARPQPLLAALLTGALLAASGLQAAPGGGEASRFHDDARSRLARNDAAGAIVQAQNALQKEPGLLAAQVLLGQALLKDGQAAAAEAQFEKALQKGARLEDVALSYGQALMMFGNSEKLLQRIPADGLPPTLRAEVLAMRATAHADLGDMPAAFRAVQQARAADIRSLSPLRAEIDLSLRQRDGARARQALAAALAMAPGDAQLLHLQGAMLQGSGDASAALAAFARALAADPQLVDAMIARASLLIDLQRFDEAMADLQRAAALTRREPRVAYLKSLVLAARGDAAGSRAQLEEVTRLVDALPEAFIARQPPLLMLGSLASQATGRSERARVLLELYVLRLPGEPAGRKLLANLYLAAGNSARVADLLEPLLRAGDPDPQVFTTLAAMRMQQGRFREAAEALEAAARAGGATPGLTAQIGFARIGNQQSEQGLALLRQAFEQNPGQLPVGTALATLLLRRGDAAGALRLAEALVRQRPDEPAAHNLLGVVRAANRQPEAARSAYNRALALAPALLPAQLNLARLDAAEGRVDAARRRLGDLLRKDGGQVQALTELGRLERAAGRLAEARPLLEKAHKLAPADQAAGTELLALYQQLGDAPAALRVAKQLAQARPDDPALLEALDRAHHAVGERAQAWAAFAKLARQAGGDAERLVAVGALQLFAGDGGGAAASAEKALSVRPGHLAAATLQVEAELAAGALERAEALQAAFARRTGNGAEARRLAGDIAMRRGQPGVALAAYRAGFERAPSSALALRAFAAAFKAGQGAEGVSLIEAWLRRQPDDLAARAALAEGSLRLDRLPAAKAAYELLLAREPGNANAANNLAQVLLRQNDERALPMAERAVSLAPDNPDALDTLGWLRARSGALDVGVKTLREARQRAPESRDIRYHLAWALHRSGQRDAARSELAAALGGRGPFDSEAEARHLRRELGV